MTLSPPSPGLALAQFCRYISFIFVKVLYEKSTIWSFLEIEAALLLYRSPASLRDSSPCACRASGWPSLWLRRRRSSSSTRRVLGLSGLEAEDEGRTSFKNLGVLAKARYDRWVFRDWSERSLGASRGGPAEEPSSVVGLSQLGIALGAEEKSLARGKPPCTMGTWRFRLVPKEYPVL